jgi:hypothetical protein
MAYKIPSGINNTSVTSIVANTVVGPAAATVVADMTSVPGAGTYLVFFNSEFDSVSTDVTAQASADLTTVVSALNALPQTATHPAAFGPLETLGPGVYDVTPGAATLSGTLTLDGGGNPNGLFVFRITAAFSTAAGSSVIVINGADAANVFWLSGGAGSTGADMHSGTFNGTIIAAPGAVSTGAGSSMTGRLFSTLGAIPIDSTAISQPLTTSVIALGSLDTFALFTSSGNVSNVGTSTITGDIGTNSGTVTGFGTATVNGTIYTAGISAFTAEYGIYANGILIPNSARLKRNNSVSQTDQTIAMQTTATVTTGQAIDARVSVNQGTITTGNRILTLIKEI